LQINIISVARSPLISFKEINWLLVDFNLKLLAFSPKSQIGVFIKS